MEHSVVQLSEEVRRVVERHGNDYNAIAREVTRLLLLENLTAQNGAGFKEK